MDIIGQEEREGIMLLCECGCKASIQFIPVGWDDWPEVEGGYDYEDYEVYIEGGFKDLPLKERIKKAWALLRGRTFIWEDVCIPTKSLTKFFKYFKEREKLIKKETVNNKGKKDGN